MQIVSKKNHNLDIFKINYNKFCNKFLCCERIKKRTDKFKNMVSLRNGKKVPFLGKKIPKRPRSYKTTLEPEDELNLATRIGSISIQNHDASENVNEIDTKNNAKPASTQADEINAKIMNFVASSKELIDKIKSSGLHESNNLPEHRNEEFFNSDKSNNSSSFIPEASISECELTFDLIDDTLVEKINETSSWDETIQVDPLLEVCEQAYNELLNDLIFEDIIYETLFPNQS